MKLCVACKTYHPKSEFKAAHRDFPTRDGLNYNCINSSKGKPRYRRTEAGRVEPIACQSRQSET